MTRNTHRAFLLKLTVAVAAAVLFTGLPSRAAKADDAAVMKISETLKLDTVGNANISLTITAPANQYTSLKTKTPNIAILLRNLGAGRHWASLENIDGKFNDISSSIEVSYLQRGFSRVVHGNEWSVPLVQAGSLDLVDIHGTTAIFNKVNGTAASLNNLIIHVVCPDGSTQLKHDANAKTLSYVFEPKVAAGSKTDATFSVDHKETIMSCLAKCYGNERFSYMWAARMRFDNTGSTVLSDYRVRARIAGFGSWGEWHHASKVYPGQTVVDPFFPVFDLDKLTALTSARPAMLEIEYQYRRHDGQLVTESDSRRLQILGSNETIFTELSSAETMNLADRYQFVPPILAAFTTPGDPVIQELAGRVCGRAQCGGASYTNQEAFKYMRSLYEFMAQNRIAYQSPPSFVDGVHNGQHIKYGRDVLRNHSGTCVDLSILWASACEAVGLKPVLVIIPGHCFVSINLPDGQSTAVETTVIGKYDFDKAVEIGLKELQQARSGESLMADVNALRKEGIQSVDLPAVPVNFLTEQGYRFDVPQVKTVAATQEPATTQTNKPTSPASPIGRWEFEGEFGNGNGEIGLALEADGRMGLVAHLHYANGRTQELRGSGHWKVDGGYLILIDQTGTSRFQFVVQNGRLTVTFPALGQPVTFNRA